MKTTYAITIFVVALSLTLAACGGQSTSSETDGTETTSADSTAETDAVSAASIVDTAEGFLEAAGANGTWIIAVTKDLTIDQEIVLDGEFTRRDELARKIALYDQDADRNVTARYTLTAPRLVVRSPNARIQGGTFVGDVYVEATGFQVIDATVDGNIYFATEEQQSSFAIEDGEVTGETALQE